MKLAIVVLFLFVVFIFDLNTTNRIFNFGVFKNGNKFLSYFYYILFSVFLIKCFIILYYPLCEYIHILNYFSMLTIDYQSEIIFFFELNNIDLIGFILYTQFPFYLIVAAFLLLIAIVGSVLLVKQNKSK